MHRGALRGSLNAVAHSLSPEGCLSHSQPGQEPERLTYNSTHAQGRANGPPCRTTEDQQARLHP
ncbi:hypothetical protein P7K49_012220, partial [Saguinus oedipus]